MHGVVTQLINIKCSYTLFSLDVNRSLLQGSFSVIYIQISVIGTIITPDATQLS